MSLACVLCCPTRAAMIEQPANLIFEIFGQARLRQERIGTGLQRALLDGLVGVAREEDHRHVTRARLGLEVLDRGDAVDSRKPSAVKYSAYKSRTSALSSTTRISAGTTPPAHGYM